MRTTVKDMMATANAAVPRISATEARELHAAGKAVSIDLREPAEIAASGKVPGALAIPRGLLDFRVDPESPAPDPALARPHGHHLLRLGRAGGAGRQDDAGSRLCRCPQSRRVQGLGGGRRAYREGLIGTV